MLGDSLLMKETDGTLGKSYREIVSWPYLLVQGLSVTTGHNLAPT